MAVYVISYKKEMYGNIMNIIYKEFRKADSEQQAKNQFLNEKNIGYSKILVDIQLDREATAKAEREERERQEREREHQEWLKTDEGQKWQEERDREEAEQQRQKKIESEKKIRLWKIGRIAALLLVVFSIIMIIFIATSGKNFDVASVILAFIIFIIPFAVVYFCEGIIKRVIFLIAGIGLAIFFITSTGINIMFISYIISLVLAMINKKDKF